MCSNFSYKCLHKLRHKHWQAKQVLFFAQILGINHVSTRNARRVFLHKLVDRNMLFRLRRFDFNWTNLAVAS